MPTRSIERGPYGAIKRAYIPIAIQRRIRTLPCVICGIPFGIRIDHIVAVAQGGGPEESNLQPLCHDCNHTKKHLRSTDEVWLIVAHRGVTHFEEAVRRWENRHAQFADGSALTVEGREWAARLYAAFVGRLA